VTEFHKLVRDGIPALIEAEGRTPVVEVLDRTQRRPALLTKLAEEAAEAAAAGDDELAEELADVLEVVRALASEVGLTFEGVVELADAKRAQRGGFNRGLFLVRTEPGG
jgi:predicted house-cleaning noncanonical NTP pyrophosphatase (MazG superfamily)